MRRYGGLRKFLPITFVDLRPRLPGDHRHPAVLRVLHQGRHHRRGLGQGRHRRLDPRRVRDRRRRHHRVLHDPGHADDLLRPEALGGEGVLGGAGAHPAYTEPHIPHPHESPLTMTRPDDPARDRLGRCRRVPRSSTSGCRTSWRRWSGVPFPDHGDLVAGPASSRWCWSFVGVGLAWAMYGRVPVPAVAPRGSVLTRAARADLYGDAFNESVLMRPGQWLTRLSVFFDSRGVDGLVNGAGRDHRRDVGAAAQAADRVRALLRAVHAHRRRAARGRPTGGEALMTLRQWRTAGTPWLTDRRRYPAGRRDRGLASAAGRALAKMIDAAVLAGRDWSG